MQDTKHEGMIPIDAEFYERVYAQVGKIPAGKVCTYGKIAEMAGYPKASREVGVAMSRVPNGSNLPCHRVVNKNGTLAPEYAFGGQEQQKKLLQGEGVTFYDDGSIEMEKYAWPDDAPVRQLTFM